MSSNALVAYSKVTDLLAFCKEMSVPYSAAANVPVTEGPAVVLACMAEGITPYQYRRRYHTIPVIGPTMRADAMRAEFRMNHGGDFKIIQNTPEVAEVLFTNKDGETFTSKMTWELAQQESWPWTKGKGPYDGKTDADRQPVPANLKDNWRGPVGRANMLLARATSSGLRAFHPEIVAGIYTPEEMEDVEIVATSSVVSSAPAAPTAAELLAQQRAEQEAAAAQKPAENVIEAEYTPATTQETGQQPTPAEKPAEKPAEQQPADGSISIGQKAEIESLLDSLGFTAEQRDNMLRRRGVAAVRSLSTEQAVEILTRLRDLDRQAKGANSGN